MVIFAKVTENERIIDRHLRGIHPRLDYDASESQSMISMWLKKAYQHYTALVLDPDFNIMQQSHGKNSFSTIANVFNVPALHVVFEYLNITA